MTPYHAERFLLDAATCLAFAGAAAGLALWVALRRITPPD